MAPRETARPSQRHRDSAAKRHHHKRRKSSSRPHRSTDESRSGAGGQSLSIDALARLNEANNRQNSTRDRVKELQKEREQWEAREKRRKRESRTRRVHGEEYHEVGRVEEKPRRHRKEAKRRVVSGAYLEEGRSRHLGGIRGGGSSYDSVEKEDLYHKPKPRWNKKRLSGNIT